MAISTNITYQTELSANLVLFCRFLRNKGMVIGVNEEAEVLTALHLLPISREIYFKEALKIIWCKNKYHQQKFEAYYLEFWEQLEKATAAKTKKLADKKNSNKKQRTKEAQFESLKKWLNLNPSEDEKEIAAHSDLEVLTKKDFSNLNSEEMQLIWRLLQKEARKLTHKKSRLQRVSKRKKQLDLKRTIKSGMRNGGEIQQLVYSQPKEQKLKLVLLCDVSRSMELYSRFFAHLIYAFQHAHDKIETFVFSTALYHVSEILNNNEFAKAFDTISERVPHWSGGTAIGSCLQVFADNYSYAMLDKKTTVLILSDGWDTGSPVIMKNAMQTIYKKSRKLIWLNPLSGNPNFNPEVIGLQTALPYIDILAPAHNLESLKEVLQQLKSGRKSVKW